MEERDRKEVERLLYNLTDLQVRASVLASQFAKADESVNLASIQLEDGTDLASEASNISSEFSIITDELSKRLGSRAVEKTMNKIAQCNIYDKELVAYYLDQLVKDMRDVSSKTKSIINADGVKKQVQQKIEQQRRDEESKKQQEMIEAEKQKTEQEKLEQNMLKKQEQEKSDERAKTSFGNQKN